MNESISRQLRNRLKDTSKAPSETPSAIPNDPLPVKDILGFMGDVAIEGITKDIQGMIDDGFRAALDGYVLAISRLMKHDTAWKCLIEAFSSKSESIPKRFYSLFGKSNDDRTQVKRMFVE